MDEGAAQIERDERFPDRPQTEDFWRLSDAVLQNDAIAREKGIEAAMDAGVLKRRPVEPLARLFLAALSEAALQIARSDDPDGAMEEMSSAVFALVESLRA